MTIGDIVAQHVGTRYTGAVVRVECGGALRYERAFGTLDGEVGSAPVLVDTRFDLASLTKVFIGAFAVRAVAAGLLSLDEPVTGFVREWAGTAHAAITLRDLLAHRSGMASGADYRTLFNERVEDFALRRSLAAPVRERVIYSDLGFIALGAVLARAHGRGLAAVALDELDALGARDTAYRPRNDGAARVPATEEDAWRGRVRGSVHDEKAALMGGVAGHAGLFGSARDVAALAEAFLAPSHGRAAKYVPAAVASEAIREQAFDPVLRRGLGWALKTSDENSCGARMSSGTFGHTGFTGTVVWADPDRDLSVVFLTNGVYFGRNDLRDVRAAVCDAAVETFA